MNAFFTRQTLALGLVCGLIGQTVLAQTPECRPEDAQQVQRPWQRKPISYTSLSSDFPKKNLPMVIERQNKLLDILQRAYPNPKGLEARAYGVIRRDPENEYQAMPAGSPLQYSVTTYYLHYWCFRGKPERSGETGTWIECYVNSLWQFMESISEDEFVLPNQQQIYYMPYVVGELKGDPVYSRYNDKRDNRHESILLVPGNRLPVRPVSREEFVRSLQGYIQRYLKDHDETTRKLEASLQETLAFADNSSAFETKAEREKYKEENRRSVETGRIKREQAAQKFRERYQRLETMLAAMSLQDRAAQAIVADPHDMLFNERGKGTFEAQAINGRPLVTHDLAYADPKLPRHAIQSIQLLMKYETAPSMVAKLELMRQFRQNIDLDGLKALLERKQP